MRVEPIVNEIFYAWVAPDGTIQLTLIGIDIPTCLALAKLWHKKGLGQSIHELKQKGFTIENINVTMIAEPEQAISEN